VIEGKTGGMKALLIGAGGMGQGWARNIAESPEAVLHAWVDVRPGAAADAAEKLGLSVPHTDTDVERAIAEYKPDFVVDVTPPEVHHSVTLAALAAGLPVLGEKPMAVTMEQAREMVAASGKAGKLYMVSQSRRYNAQLQAYKQLIQDQVGTVGILNADFYIGAHFGGFRDEMDSPLILDMAIHTFDEARYLCDLDAVSVYAEEFNPAWSWYKGDSSATAIFEMENGARFTYRGSWCSDGCHTSWDADWRAVGPKGSAVWADNTTPTAQSVIKSGGFFSEMESIDAEVGTIDEGIKGSLSEFLSALKTGITPNGECHDNIKSLAMVFAVVESSKAGRRVKLSEIL